MMLTALRSFNSTTRSIPLPPNTPWLRSGYSAATIISPRSLTTSAPLSDVSGGCAGLDPEHEQCHGYRTRAANDSGSSLSEKKGSSSISSLRRQSSASHCSGQRTTASIRPPGMYGCKAFRSASSIARNPTLPNSRYFSTTTTSFLSSSSSDITKRIFPSANEEEWETIIGLEVHVQLRTRRKLFSEGGGPLAATAGDRDEGVLNRNSGIGGNAGRRWGWGPGRDGQGAALLDMATPGTLPVVNKKAVELVLKTALALDCHVNHRSTFDRKHYFYHDIPASYQITQKYNPIATNGKLEFDVPKKGSHGHGNSDRFSVRIQQIQLEQDTAKSTREPTAPGGVHVDLTRAGMGLMEIVSEPDMRSPAEAAGYVRALQKLLRRLGASDGDMEKGSMRVDANVSIHRKGSGAWGTRCEIKNLNSVRFMVQALESERRRHLAFYASHPGASLPQETRGFDEASGETYSLRSKEDAEDYRYMPDLNLPPLAIEPTYLQHLRESLPELPDQLRDRLATKYDITKTDVETLVGFDERELTGVRYFETVMKALGHTNGKKALNWITHEISGRLATMEQAWHPELISAEVLAELVKLVEDGKLTGTAAKTLTKHLLENPSSAPTSSHLLQIAQTLKLVASEGAPSLAETCRQVLERSPQEIESFRKGNERVVMRLVGHVMKQSKGTADARKAAELLMQMLRG